MSHTVLSIENLCKSYTNIRALQNISFKVPKGAVYGILGPNGSGKTTLLGVIMDVLKQDSGTYSWFESGSEFELRKKIGTLLETPNFYQHLSAYNNLAITALIKGIDEDAIIPSLKRVNLHRQAEQKYATFSLGMKQRLAIAASLLGDPEVLVLDEPTNGLDPVGIVDVRNLILELRNSGKTIIITSHLLDEIDKVCSHVLILNKGIFITSGKVSDIIGEADIVELSADEIDDLTIAIRDYEGFQKMENINGILTVAFAKGCGNTKKINTYCHSKGITLSTLMIKKRSMEERFFELTKQ
jgi:ABC-2 type transport system ATP-binding protein